MYNIVFCCDDNYIIPASVSIESLLKNNKEIVDRIEFFTFHEGISDFNFARLSDLISGYGSRLNSIQLIPGFRSIIDRIPTLDYISEATFFRLLLPYVLPNVDVCLFIDVDTLIRGSIKQIWDYYSDGICISAVADLNSEALAKRLGLSQYCNAGVLLMNLQEMRDLYSYDEFAEKIQYVYENYEIKMADQDLLNIIFQEHMTLIPDIYNFQKHLCRKKSLTMTHDIDTIVIVHFIMKYKPWKADYFCYFFREYYRYYRNYLSKGDKVAFGAKRFVAFFIKLCKKIYKAFK